VADVSETVSFRATPAEKRLLEEVAEHQMEKLAQLVRRIALEFAREYVKGKGGVETVLEENLERRRKKEIEQARTIAALLNEV
jgi:hypothetical protein